MLECGPILNLSANQIQGVIARFARHGRRFSMMASNSHTFSKTLMLVSAAFVAMGLMAIPAVPASAQSGTWALTGNMKTGRSGQTATLLPSGLVLVAGGFDGSNSLASAELYNPATGKWAATGSTNTARDGHTATLLPNGQVLVAGGFANVTSYFSSAELYNPTTGTWTVTGSMSTARIAHTATLLPNGQVLVTGGQVLNSNRTLTYSASAELCAP